ncbi:MAG: transglutaminase-like domain-containing protein, partial [Vicinamibacteria bacterium]
MRFRGRGMAGGVLRAAAFGALAASLGTTGRAGTLDDRALAQALEESDDALRAGRSAGALAAQIARLSRADAAHRARFARAEQVASSGGAAERLARAREAYDAGQGRLLALVREAVAGKEGAAQALAEARELHARIEAGSAPSPVSAGPRVRAPRLSVPALPTAAAATALEPQGLEPPIGSVPAALREAADALAGPVEVYEWVRNTIRPEYYHGRMKGPLETFLEQSGNDVDTAGVLVEMLRAKGVPARYVRGVVEVPSASIASITGTADVSRALRVLARAGIPHEPVAGPSGPIAVRLHRVWVEAYL